MNDLVARLRYYGEVTPSYEDNPTRKLMREAADAIEALQAEVDRKMSAGEYLLKEIAVRDLVIKQAKALTIRTVDLLESYKLYGHLRADLEEFSDSQPSTEAIDAYVAEKVAAERERCANMCEDIDAINSRGWGDVLAKRIRQFNELGVE